MKTKLKEIGDKLIVAVVCKEKNCFKNKIMVIFPPVSRRMSSNILCSTTLFYVGRHACLPCFYWRARFPFLSRVSLLFKWLIPLWVVHGIVIAGLSVWDTTNASPLPLVPGDLTTVSPKLVDLRMLVTGARNDANHIFSVNVSITAMMGVVVLLLMMMTTTIMMMMVTLKKIFTGV